MEYNLKEVNNKTSANFREALIAEKDRKMPLHEEIVLWLYDELETKLKNSKWFDKLKEKLKKQQSAWLTLLPLKELLTELFVNTEWETKIDGFIELLNEEVSLEKLFSIKRKLEIPIKQDKYILGYGDIYFEISILNFDSPLITALYHYNKEKNKKDDSYWGIKQKEALPEKYRELILSIVKQGKFWARRHNGSYDSVLFEVKSVLPTLGDLIRQLQYYRQIFSQIIVVGTDDKYAKILEEQGFGYVNYKSETIIENIFKQLTDISRGPFTEKLNIRDIQDIYDEVS